MNATGRREATDERTAIVMLDGQPHYLGSRAAEIARYLVDEARVVNRDDLESLEFRVNEQANPRCIDPHVHIRSKRRRY